MNPNPPTPAQASPSVESSSPTHAPRDHSGDDTLGVRWRELQEPADVARALVDLYRERGGGTYDERVTQTAHALQCGSLAMAAGSDLPTVAAAFLHDVGHLLSSEEGTARARAAEVDLRHEDTGSRFLANWFGPEVTRPIQGHVAAKRYLCAVESSYFGTLSPGSVHSLQLQGGPMTAEEVAAFEADPLHQAAVDLRRWDEQGKDPKAPTPDLEVFEGLLVELLCRD